MFGLFNKKETRLEGAIDDVLKEMAYENSPSTERYAQLLETLEKLHALKTKESRPRVSADQALLVGGNLLGILIIVAYEQKHVFGSKGQSFLLKPK